MNPILATILSIEAAAVACVLWAWAQSGTSVFGTKGHLSSEMKVVAVVILTAVIGMWAGLYAITGLVECPADRVLAYAEVTSATSAYASNATWAIAVTAAAYTLGRSVIKHGKAAHK